MPYRQVYSAISFCCKALNSDQLCCPLLHPGENNDYVLPFFVSWESNMHSSLKPATSAILFTVLFKPLDPYLLPALCFYYTALITVRLSSLTARGAIVCTFPGITRPSKCSGAPHAKLHIPNSFNKRLLRAQRVQANMSPKILAKLLLKAVCMPRICTRTG